MILKRLRTAALALLSFGLIFSSCSHGVKPVVDDGKTYIKVGNVSSRTALPAVSAMADFDSFKLTGVTKTRGAVSVDENWHSDDEKSAYDAMTSASIAVTAGAYYDFTLIAKKNDAVWTATAKKTIEQGANTLNFVLDFESLSNDGKGSLNVSVTFPSQVAAVEAVLTKDSEDSAVNVEGTPLSFENHTATYTASDLDSGNYTLTFKLYGDEEKTLSLGSWLEYAGISKGFTSSDTVTANSIENIYTLTLNYGEGSLSSGTAVPGSFTRYSDEIILPTPVRAQYAFKGWYKTETPSDTDTPVTKIEAGTVGNVTLYAVWEYSPNFTVTFIASDDEDLEEANKPVYCTQKVSPGEKIIKPEGHPDKGEGYTFGYWVTRVYPDENDDSHFYTEEYNFDTTVPDDDVVLYPYFYGVKITVTFVDGNSITEGYATYSYDDFTGYPQKKGYRNEFYLDADFNTPVSFPIYTLEDMTVYVKYIPITGNVHFRINTKPTDISVVENVTTGDKVAPPQVDEQSYYIGALISYYPTNPLLKAVVTGYKDNLGNIIDLDNIIVTSGIMYVDVVYATNYHTITYMQENNREYNTAYVADGDIAVPYEYSLVSDPVAFGYWYEVGDSDTPFDFTKPITEDVKLYPKTGQTVSVTFKAYDGTTKVVNVMERCKVKEPEEPQRDGLYTFDGWYQVLSNGNLSDTPFDFNSLVTTSLTLQQKWNSTGVTVTFNTAKRSGGKSTSNISPVTINKGESVTPPANPVYSSHLFLGWYESSDGGETLSSNKFAFSTKISSDLTLYAKWASGTKSLPDAIGDIIFKDGTASPYNEVLTDTEKVDFRSVFIGTIDGKKVAMKDDAAGNKVFAWETLPHSNSEPYRALVNISCATSDGASIMSGEISYSDRYFEGMAVGGSHYVSYLNTATGGTSYQYKDQYLISYVGDFDDTTGLGSNCFHVPTLAELFFIYSCKDKIKAAFTSAGKTCPVDYSKTYWSANTSDDINKAFAANFSTGKVEECARSEKLNFLKLYIYN